ncbi:MAG: pyruvate kinase [Actinobacteria bacterium]|nr:pyruvate kinase [Actinomycetota bacterium]
MRHAKIVCTIGPSSRNLAILEGMIEAGMDVARMNMAHGSVKDHESTVKLVREASARTGKDVAILMDLAGPKLRIGDFETGEVLLREESRFTITTRPIAGNEEAVSINYPDLPKDVQEGSIILINEGLIVLKVEEVSGEDVRCRVVSGGTLYSRRGVNLPDITLSISPITEKEKADVPFGIEHEVDWFGLSFVRRAFDVGELRRLISDHGGKQRIIAKIEKREAVDNVDEIIDKADGVMIARGDLGVELPTEDVPLVQKELIFKARVAARPVITATQMLESMIQNPRPTRAEVSDVANAILDGTDAVMLSGETAMGKYPVETVKIMSSVIGKSEQALKYGDRLPMGKVPTTSEAIGATATELAELLEAKAIVTSTESGATARQVSKHRPRAPIIAAAFDPVVLRQTRLSWGVIPVKVPHSVNVDDMFDIAARAATESRFVKKEELIVITAGVRVNVPGTTNLIKVQRIR